MFYPTAVNFWLTGQWNERNSKWQTKRKTDPKAEVWSPWKDAIFKVPLCTSYWTYHITFPQFALVNCQAYGLGPRNQPPCTLARSEIDSAGQILPRLLLLILSTTCLTSALCRYSGGPESSKYHSGMMHRTKHTLPHSLCQPFSLQVPLKTKSRKHLQSLLLAGRMHTGGKSAEQKGAISPLHLC